MEDTKVNNKYKDRLFKKVFEGKEAILSLYNAVNGSDYSNPDDIEINTIDDFVYMGMKNDVSFLFTDVLNLYEHQSTYNPNMPLRGLLYLSRLYQKILGNTSDIYSSTLLRIPTPQFIVFYNGTTKEPDIRELKLSDSFEGISAFEPCLECKAIMLNINYGHNKELMDKCNKLREYAIFVYYVRENLAKRIEQVDAINAAADRCIQEGILKELLETNRNEVVAMLLSEYNEALHIQNEKNISYDEGKAEGKADINALNMWLITSNRMEDLKKAAGDPEFQQMLFEEFLAEKK